MRYAPSCVSSPGEKRLLPVAPYGRYVKSAVSVDADASKLQGTMIDKVINHRIGKSLQPLPPAAVAFDAHTRISHTSVTANACLHTAGNARIRLPINASVRRLRTGRLARGNVSIAREPIGINLFYRDAARDSRQDRRGKGLMSGPRGRKYCRAMKCRGCVCDGN